MIYMCVIHIIYYRLTNASFQLLLINANKIECIKADTFASLTSLNLL